MTLAFKAAAVAIMILVFLGDILFVTSFIKSNGGLSRSVRSGFSSKTIFLLAGLLVGLSVLVSAIQLLGNLQSNSWNGIFIVAYSLFYWSSAFCQLSCTFHRFERLTMSDIVGSWRNVMLRGFRLTINLIIIISLVLNVVANSISAVGTQFIGKQLVGEICSTVSLIADIVLVLADNAMNICMVRIVLTETSNNKLSSLSPAARNSKAVVSGAVTSNAISTNSPLPLNTAPPDISTKSTRLARKRLQLTLLPVAVMLSDLIGVGLYFGSNLFYAAESEDGFYMKGLSCTLACTHIIFSLILLLELKNNASTKSKSGVAASVKTRGQRLKNILLFGNRRREGDEEVEHVTELPTIDLIMPTPIEHPRRQNQKLESKLKGFRENFPSLIASSGFMKEEEE